MTAWLEIPLPAGDLQEIEHAASLLGRYASDTHHGAHEMGRVGASLRGAWEGQAALAFAGKSAAAVTAINRVADVEAEAARLLEAYAREWRATHDTAIRAHAALDTAVADYLHAAPSALHGVASHLEGFLSGALNAVLSLAGNIVGEVHHAVARVSSWTPPAARPQLFLLQELEGHSLISGDTVLHSLTSGGDWGVSHLLDAAHGVAHLVGGALHGAMNAVHSVEHAFASAVAAAHRMIHDALVTLAAAAKRAAAAVERLAVETAQTVFRAVTEVVRAGVHFAGTVGNGLLHLAHSLDQVGRGLAAVVVIKTRVTHGLRNTHRLSDQAYRAANDAAALKWATSKTYEGQVIARSKLAVAAYDDTGAPAGWERVDTIHGTDGFAAAVFYCPATRSYVVAFRGSEPHLNTLNDWGQDAQNAAGFPTSQGRQAQALALELAKKYDGQNLSFTGHSLGGSLASIASLATGKQATTFNAASVGDGNYAAAVNAGHGKGSSELNITNFRATHDILTGGQERTGVGFASGGQVTLSTNAPNPIGAHDIEQMVFPDVRYEGQP